MQHERLNTGDRVQIKDANGGDFNGVRGIVETAGDLLAVVWIEAARYMIPRTSLIRLPLGTSED